jgi:three-Cys-motif partner protein
MAAPQTTIWSMDRHTQAKHEILRRYLGAWVPILVNQCGRARIIDGFAGPGKYEGGQVGSPLIALQTLLTHPDKKVQDAIHKGTVELIFIERDPRRSEHLQQLLTEQKQDRVDVPKLQLRIITGTFLEEMGKLLTLMERQNNVGKPTPTFVFIDPFGYSHAPLSMIGRIMNLPMCEVLINFMYDEINRFLTVSDPIRQQYYDRLFGTDQWRQIAQQSADPDERRRLQHNLYRHQLLTAGNARYERSFRMLNEHNATDYYLFFGTNSMRGLEEMKRAMWGVDRTGGFEFSDFSNPYQPLLLTEPNYANLQRLLSSRFRRQTVPIEEIEAYVLADTPYISYKQNALAPMEASSPPKIRVHLTDPGYKRKKGTFPAGKALIEFL